jgi:hypothetical protein
VVSLLLDHNISLFLKRREPDQGVFLVKTILPSLTHTLENQMKKRFLPVWTLAPALIVGLAVGSVCAKGTGTTPSGQAHETRQKDCVSTPPAGGATAKSPQQALSQVCDDSAMTMSSPPSGRTAAKMPSRPSVDAHHPDL